MTTLFSPIREFFKKGDVLLLDYGPESFYNSVSRVFYGVRHD